MATRDKIKEKVKLLTNLTEKTADVICDALDLFEDYKKVINEIKNDNDDKKDKKEKEDSV